MKLCLLDFTRGEPVTGVGTFFAHPLTVTCGCQSQKNACFNTLHPPIAVNLEISSHNLSDVNVPDSVIQ